MDTSTWQKLYNNVSSVQPKPAIVGFNVNLDRIIAIDRVFLSSALFNLPVLAELQSRLQHSMRTCTAEEWFVSDQQLYQLFLRIFSSYGHLSIGGQAGIAAVHMASMGFTDVLCITDSSGPETGKILDTAGVQLLDFNKACKSASDTIHLVFEYPPGIVPVDDGIIPRQNRFIISPVHSPESVLIPRDNMDVIEEAIQRYTRAFLSGYQYLRTDDEFRLAADQILLMKKNNPMMRVHVECVSVTDYTIISGFIHHILPAADSIGLNEHELNLLVDCLVTKTGEQEFVPLQSPAQLIQGALAISRKSGLKRLHLHTFGYYVQVTRNDCVHPETSLYSLLFAARIVAQAANGSTTEISPSGIVACEEAEKIFGPPVSTGIFRNAAHTIIIIPTILAKDIQKSSGLGDILSSSAFVTDEF
jgi:ADP-dependent phosphofructokinase/glucokinase